MEANTPIAATRAELLLRRYIKNAWLFVLFGVLIPVLAFMGAYRGLRLMRSGRRQQGLPLLLVGSAVFLLRLGLWMQSGLRHPL